MLSSQHVFSFVHMGLMAMKVIQVNIGDCIIGCLKLSSFARDEKQWFSLSLEKRFCRAVSKVLYVVFIALESLWVKE